MAKFKIYDKNISIKLSQKQYDNLKEYCIAHGITMNDLVRCAIDYLTGEHGTPEKALKGLAMKLESIVETEEDYF